MSKIKLITYDLCDPYRNYDELYKRIKSYGAYIQICESVWLIHTYDSCEMVCKNLNYATDLNDKLFVSEITNSVAWTNVICNTNDLKKFLS